MISAHVACDFCDEFAGGDDNAWRHLAEEDRVVLATDRFRVVPSLGQIGRAHLLVIPAAHVRGLSELDCNAQAEAEDLIRGVTSALLRSMGEAVAFEHGTVGPTPGATGCGIVHAHLHVVALPGETELSPPTSGSLGPWKALPESGWIKLLPKDSDYVTLSRPAHGLHGFWRADRLPSQFMRRWLAGELAQRQWDWRVDTEVEVIHERADALRVALRGYARCRSAEFVAHTRPIARPPSMR